MVALSCAEQWDFEPFLCVSVQLPGNLWQGIRDISITDTFEKTLLSVIISQSGYYNNLEMPLSPPPSRRLLALLTPLPNTTTTTTTTTIITTSPSATTNAPFTGTQVVDRETRYDSEKSRLVWEYFQTVRLRYLSGSVALHHLHHHCHGTIAQSHSQS